MDRGLRWKISHSTPLALGLNWLFRLSYSPFPWNSKPTPACNQSKQKNIYIYIMYGLTNIDKQHSPAWRRAQTLYGVSMLSNALLNSIILFHHVNHFPHVHTHTPSHTYDSMTSIVATVHNLGTCARLTQTMRPGGCWIRRDVSYQLLYIWHDFSSSSFVSIFLVHLTHTFLPQQVGNQKREGQLNNNKGIEDFMNFMIKNPMCRREQQSTNVSSTSTHRRVLTQLTRTIASTTATNSQIQTHEAGFRLEYKDNKFQSNWMNQRKPQ